MPMPGDFNWRPNDNSATTLLRYKLEAEKWVSAVSSAQRKIIHRNPGKDLYFIGLIIQLIFSFALLVLLFFLKVFKWSINQLIEKRWKTSKITKGFGAKKGNSRQIIPLKRSQPNPFLYDSEGNLWGIWEFLFSFIFIFICVYVALGLVAHFFKPGFDMADKGFLYFTCAVSAFFALTAGD